MFHTRVPRKRHGTKQREDRSRTFDCLYRTICLSGSSTSYVPYIVLVMLQDHISYTAESNMYDLHLQREDTVIHIEE